MCTSQNVIYELSVGADVAGDIPGTTVHSQSNRSAAVLTLSARELSF